MLLMNVEAFEPAFIGEPMVIGGRYELVQLISITGFSIIYKAKDLEDDRFVVIKMAKASEDEKPSKATQLLRRESIALGRLKGISGIAHLLKSGFAEGCFFIVLEYIDGTNLDELIGLSSLSVDESISIGLNTLAVLCSVHLRGVLHLDLKASNVVVDEDNDLDLKVIDFGLARFVCPAGPEMNQLFLDPSNFFGTLGCASPEQATAGKDLDHRSDLFSFAVLLHEMLTGRSPFTELEGVPFWWPQYFNPFPTVCSGHIPRKIQEVVLRGLATNPDARYQTAEEMRFALHVAAGRR